MQTEPQQNSPMAFAESFRDELLKALSTQCGSAWKSGDSVAEDVPEVLSDPFHAVFTFEGSLNGDLHLNLATDAALALASALLGQVSDAMGDVQRDALVEFLDGALPGFCESVAGAHGIFTASLTVTDSPSPDDVEAHTYTLADEQGVEVRLQLLLASDLAASLAEQVLAKEAEAEQALAEQAEAMQAEATRLKALEAEAQQAVPQPLFTAAAAPVTPLGYPPVPTEPVNLDLVLDVELNVTLRFGQRQLTLREVLELTSGSVIELDRQVEEPVELLLDGKVIARGEAVVIDGNYGLRVTEVPQQFTPTMLR